MGGNSSCFLHHFPLPIKYLLSIHLLPNLNNQHYRLAFATKPTKSNVMWSTRDIIAMIQLLIEALKLVVQAVWYLLQQRRKFFFFAHI
jgi:hypothetical protein